MKKYIGKKISVLVNGILCEGTLISDTADRIVLVDKDKVKNTVIKNKISVFKCADESPVQGIQVIGCQNPKLKCKGIRYIVAKDKVEDSDYETFMNDCPVKNKDCQKGSMGDIIGVDRKELSGMLDNTIYGDYPEKKGNKK